MSDITIPRFLITPFLTHLPLVPHICVGELGQHWFRQRLVACSAPSHYLNQCCLIVNWPFRNKLRWNYYQNIKLSIHENASENVVCDMVPILSMGRWVKCWIGYLERCLMRQPLTTTCLREVTKWYHELMALASGILVIICSCTGLSPYQYILSIRP